jgi:hypothetical protein
VKGIRCKEFVEQVTAFLDAGLDANVARRLVEHVALCQGCERYLDQMRTIIRTLHSLSS